METVNSRSESPFPKSKSKNQSPDLLENRDVNEQMKTKTKTQQSKQKSHLNKKENVNSATNGNDYFNKEVLKSHEIEGNGENNDDNKENDNDVDLENGNDNSNVEEKENEGLVSSNEEKLEKMDKNSDENVLREPLNDVDSMTNDVDIVGDELKENGNSKTHETESSAKKGSTVEGNTISSDSEIIIENIEEISNGETNNSSEPTQIQVDNEDFIVEHTSQNGVNSSDDGSHYEDAHTTQKDQIQVSPDTASKEEGFFSNKISNFLGKWNSAEEQKHDLEILSKVNCIQSSDGKILNHPYLSKVSGRRGIKDKINSSMISLTSSNDEIKTPTNLTPTLDDSFRVRTNPTRLNSSELQQNPTLRKFKGKRCLNANDDPEDGEDNVFLTMTKRIKLDEKTQESGLLGSILWSPFRKKSIDSENSLKLRNTESKLSRFLSPFWFWKKTAETQKGK